MVKKSWVSESNKARSIPFDDKYIPEPNSGCWLWIGAYDRNGYGRITRGGKTRIASRYIWEQKYGPIPKGMNVLHRCDVTCCVNPDHLFLGTPQENMDDKMNKGRHKCPKGSKCGGSILTEEDVLNIRKDTRNQMEISKEYKVDHATISQIKLRKTWRHV